MTEPRMPMDLTCDEVRDLAASFVLDALDPDEMDAVRAHLARHGDAPMDVAHPEFLELASVLPVLAESVPEVEPPAGLKDRIMAAAAADLEARGGAPAPTSAAAGSAAAGSAAARTAAVTTSTADTAAAGTALPADTAAAPTPFPSTAERQQRAERRGTSTGSWILRIAAVLAIVLVGGFALLQTQRSDLEIYQANVAAVTAAASQPGSLAAELAPEGGSPTGVAAVTADGTVKLAVGDLAPTAGTEVYEAWVIAADGVPVPLGSFTVGPSGTAYFEGSGLPTTSGIVLALTREPGPGATAPTPPIVVSGTATAAT